MFNNLIQFNVKGDTILLTSHSLHIFVSSKILQYASLLFKTIFSDKNIKSKFSTNFPSVIPVFNLYASSLHFVCGILHGYNNSTWQLLLLKQLFNVAIMAIYKLCCQDCINWLIELYLKSFLIEPKLSKNIINLFVTAIVYRLKRIFQELLIMLVYKATAPLTQLFSCNSGKVLRKTLLDNNLLFIQAINNNI